MVETLHPDVYVSERRSTPSIPGVSTTTPAFLVYTEKGPTDKYGLVTSFSDFVRQYGSYYQGSLGVYGVKSFFDTVGFGARAYIARIVGAGALKSEKSFKNMSAVGTPAEVIGQVAIPTVDLTRKHYLHLTIDALPVGGVDVDLNAVGLSPAGARTIADIVSSINAVFPGTASAVGNYIMIRSTTIGASSTIVNAPTTTGDYAAQMTGTALDLTALNSGNYAIVLSLDGLAPVTIDVTGDMGATPGTYTLNQIIVNINAAAAIAFGPTYNAIASPVGGLLRITSPITGVTSRIDLQDGPPGLCARQELFGFPEGTGTISQVGGTGDAVLLTLGLPEGSTYTFTGSDTIPEIGKIKAYSEGKHGDGISYTFTKWKADLMAPVLTGAEEATLSSVKNVKVGDVVKISDGTTTIIVHVNEIDYTASKILFTGQASSHLTIGAGANRVLCSSTHRKVTKTTSAITATSTQVDLEASSGLKIGTRIVLDDMVHPVITTTVNSINGNTITFPALGQVIDSGAIVSSMHFDLYVKDKGELVEVISFLSVESTDTADYYVRRLSGDANESKYISAEALAYALSNPLGSLPEATVLDYVLTGGNDGATPTDLDYVGNDVAPKSGVYLFDDADDVSVIAAPGVTYTTTLRRLISYCENRGILMLVADMPLEYDEALEARDFKMNKLAVDSSYYAIYYPWIKMRDPESDNSESMIDVPPSGFVVGGYVRIALEQNISVSPANFRLLNADGLTHYTTDGEQDILNPIGVNVIRFFSGRGIVVWGARTGWNLIDGTHYVSVRRLLNYVKASMKAGNRWVIFKNNDPSLWTEIESVNRDFLRGLWSQGMLYPSTDVTKALFVKCDAENNINSERKLGRVHLDVGINPPYPAEFVIIKVGLWDGGESIEEVIRR